MVGRARAIPAGPLAAACAGEADRFDPKAPGQPRGAYLPFGAGPRMCIGEQFAWSEAATMLAEMGQTWRLRVHDAPLTAGPLLDDLAAGRPGAGDDRAADVVIWPE